MFKCIFKLIFAKEIKEIFSYNIMGVQSQVATYYWDMSSIKLLSMKEIEMMGNFAIAERNVLSDFGAENIFF